MYRRSQGCGPNPSSLEPVWLGECPTPRKGVSGRVRDCAHPQVAGMSPPPEMGKGCQIGRTLPSQGTAGGGRPCRTAEETTALLLVWTCPGPDLPDHRPR